MKLTIGMAHFEDFHGVYFTIQSIRMHHKFKDIQIVVIDNSPDTPHGNAVKQLMGWVPNSKYVPFKESHGTTQTREKVFEVADGDAVVCLDCHVLLDVGSIDRLMEFYEANPNTKNLYSGPMLYDNLAQYTTHFNLFWRSEMWGTWGDTYKCGNCGYLYSKNNEGKPCTLEFKPKNIESNTCQCGAILDMKIKHGGHPDDAPFEIPAQGLGLFTCMKNAWLGFNKEMRGFGGEEGYIHEKYRQAGHKAICLPFLRWLHRFGRPDGVKYELSRHNKVRNYVIGWSELGLDLTPIKEHFVDTGLYSQHDWDSLLYNLNLKSPPNTDEILEMLKTHRPDLYWIKEKVEGFNSVTEFTNTGESSLSVLSAKPKKYWTYTKLAEKLAEIKRDSIDIRVGLRVPQRIEDTDVLLIMDCENDEEFGKYLGLAGPSAKKRIIINRTIMLGGKMNIALKTWCEKQNDGWFVAETFNEGPGYIMLSRIPEDKPTKPIHLWDPQFGPGTELKKMLKLFGITATEQCSCNRYAAMMNMNGPEWCTKNIDTILDWLKSEADRRRLPFIKAGAKIIVKRAIKNAEKNFSSMYNH